MGVGPLTIELIGRRSLPAKDGRRRPRPAYNGRAHAEPRCPLQRGPQRRTGIRSSLSRWTLAPALAALLGFAQGAGAEGEADAAGPRWIPSLSLGFDTFSYDTQTSVQNFLNPPAQEGSADTDNVLFLGDIGAELMGPAFEGLPGRPRLFAQGGVQLRTFSSSEIFSVGFLGRGDTAIDILRFQNTRKQDNAGRIGGQGCEQRPEPCITKDASEFVGQGSQVDARYQIPAWSAALGVAFDVPLTRSTLLQVKPSIAYQFERIDLSGQMKTVIEVAPIPDPDTPGATIPQYEIHQGLATGSSDDHSLGMGLERSARVDCRTNRTKPRSRKVGRSSGGSLSATSVNEVQHDARVTA